MWKLPDGLYATWAAYGETGYLSGSRAVRVCHWPFRRDASEFTKCTGAQERPGVRPSEGAG
jgi:hypothetical protein